MYKMTKIKSINLVLRVQILLLFLLVFGIPEINAATYYVSPNGSNSNNGSIGSPWRTIIHAIGNSGGGDTVMVRTGTYNEGDIWIQGAIGQGGSQGEYWTLKNYPGEEPTISGSATRVIIDSARYVRFQGFHMDSAMINVVGWGGIVPNHIEILNNRVTGAYNVYAGAINVIGTNCLVEGNTLNLTYTGSSNDHGIYILAGDTLLSDNITIRNNHVSGFSGYGIHLYDERKSSNDPIRNISNIIIENNFVTGSQLRAGIIVAAGPLCRIQGIMIRNNVVTENATYGIGAYYEGAGVDNIKIYNNTTYRYGNAGIIVGSGITNVDIKNNIIDNTGGGSAYHIDNSGGSSTTADNNLYWPGSPALQNIADAHPVSGDPLFVSPGTGDLHIQGSSRAMETGLSLPEVTSDKDGNPRPMDGDNDGTARFDIGAYELLADNPAAPAAPKNLEITQ